jgi:hypothetical protein
MGSRPSGTVVLEKLIERGETVSLAQVPGRYQTVALAIDPSLWGRIRSTAYHPSAVRIKLSLADQSDRQYRVIPAMARNEFLLNPFCEDTLDILNIYRDVPGQRVVSLTLETGKHDADLKPKVKITIREYPFLVTQKVSNADVEAWNNSLNHAHYPMLKSSPIKVQSPGILTRLEDGKPILRIPPDGEVVYRPSGKDRQITGKFGIERAAYDSKGDTDGVLFIIEHIAPDGNRASLFERHLDPKSRPDDRGSQSFQVALPANHDGTIVLRTTNMPGHRGKWDWSYWTEVELTE